MNINLIRLNNERAAAVHQSVEVQFEVIGQISVEVT